MFNGQSCIENCNLIDDSIWKYVIRDIALCVNFWSAMLRINWKQKTTCCKNVNMLQEYGTNFER